MATQTLPYKTGERFVAANGTQFEIIDIWTFKRHTQVNVADFRQGRERSFTQAEFDKLYASRQQKD